MRTCSRCGQTKPLSDFGVQRYIDRSDAPKAACKKCHAERQRQWVRDNPELAREVKRRHRAGPRGVRHARRWRERIYGLTEEEHEALLLLQEGRCAICFRHKDDLDRGLVVDHDHQTGAVRGLLCDDCNLGIGRFGDDPARLEEAAGYLATRMDAAYAPRPDAEVGK